jgi:hypothetical protein
MSKRFDLLNLGEVQNFRGVIYLECRACRRSRFFYPAHVPPPHNDPARNIRSLPFTCQQCGERPWRMLVYTPLYARHE